MRPLYQAADRIEAQLLKDYLATYRIASVVLGDYLAGAAGELPANLFPTLWVVDDADFARARELLAERHEQHREQGPWRCPNCGCTVESGFDLCWNCSSARD